MKIPLNPIVSGGLVGILGGLIGFGLAIVGSMTADDLTAEQNDYCKNVYEETHPDYKNIFAKSCIGWLTEHDKSVN